MFDPVAYHARLTQKDPAAARRFIAELRKQGVDVSSFCPDPDAETMTAQGDPLVDLGYRKAPQRYDGEAGDANGARPSFRGANADSVKAVRRQLTGEASREYRKAMGEIGEGYIGPSYSPEGNLRLHLGCPGDYRRQQAERARRGGR